MANFRHGASFKKVPQNGRKFIMNFSEIYLKLDQKTSYDELAAKRSKNA